MKKVRKRSSGQKEKSRRRAEEFFHLKDAARVAAMDDALTGHESDGEIAFLAIVHGDGLSMGPAADEAAAVSCRLNPAAAAFSPREGGKRAAEASLQASPRQAEEQQPRQGQMDKTLKSRVASKGKKQLRFSTAADG